MTDADYVRILRAISEYWTAYGYAPSIRDVAVLVDLPTTTTAERLDDLEAEGAITRAPGIPRSMRVVKRGQVTS